MLKWSRQNKKVPKSNRGVLIVAANLILLIGCFFVILIMMSTSDQDKFEGLIASFSGGIGISKGSIYIEDGSLISGGIIQLQEIKTTYQNAGLKLAKNSDTEYMENDNQEQIQLNQSTQMQDEIEDMLNKQNIFEQISIEVNSKYVQLTINETLLFDDKQSEVRQDAKPFLDKIGEVLKNYSDQSIEIVGYTDNVPIAENEQFSDNIDLSTARAKNITLYMVNEKNIEISHIKFLGRGDYEPTASNDTKQGRALNRRMEIIIYNKLNSY